MGELVTDCGAVLEATVFLHHFSELPDPRQAVKVVYPLIAQPEVWKLTSRGVNGIGLPSDIGLR